MLDDRSTILETCGADGLGTGLGWTSPEDLARWRATRSALRWSLKQEFDLPESLARQAVVEAEAVAALTEFPRFVVWTLAFEKAATLQRWHRHQQQLLARTAPWMELGLPVVRRRPDVRSGPPGESRRGVVPPVSARPITPTTATSPSTSSRPGGVDDVSGLSQAASWSE